MGSSHAIDWVSFTYPKEEIWQGVVDEIRNDETGEIEEDREYRIVVREMRRLAHRLEYLLPDKPDEVGQGRRGFEVSLRRPKDTPQTCFIWGGKSEIILIEIPGQGCKKLHREGRLKPLLRLYNDRVTRIDIANDLECDTNPVAFAEMRGNTKFKSGGHWKSETGETVYIGSPKSDRMCRVYRYNEPHPRANLLRIEYVLRREQAKQVARLCGSEPVDKLSLSLAQVFEWKHPAFADNTAEPLHAVPRSETGSQDTILWLHKQVRPAIQRLISQGILDRTEVLKLLHL